MQETSMDYPYDHDYKVNVSINSSSDEVTGTINPSSYYEYTEDEWNDLSDYEKEVNLDSYTRQWTGAYITTGWSV